MPNNALAFRPAADVLAALGEAPPASPGARATEVWRDVDGRLEPTRVGVGLVGQEFTEIVGGPLKAGDLVVTSALIPHAGFLARAIAAHAAAPVVAPVPSLERQA